MERSNKNLSKKELDFWQASKQSRKELLDVIKIYERTVRVK